MFQVKLPAVNKQTQVVVVRQVLLYLFLYLSSGLLKQYVRQHFPQ